MQVEELSLEELDLSGSETIACFIKYMADEAKDFHIDISDHEALIALLTGLGHRRDFVKPLAGRIASCIEQLRRNPHGSLKGQNSLGHENNPAN